MSIFFILNFFLYPPEPLVGLKIEVVFFFFLFIFLFTGFGEVFNLMQVPQWRKKEELLKERL